MVCAAVAVLASAFLYGTPGDEEEFRFAVLSTWVRARALAHAEYPYWFSNLGFGTPQPFVPHFGLHPLLPLLAVLSPVTWVRILLLAHTLAGAAGMWMLCRRLQLACAVGAVCVVTYLLAAPVQNYVLSDFWPTPFLVWTASPWVLLFTWRLLEDSWRHSWRAGLALGVVAGVTIANTNPGHAAIYVAPALGIGMVYGRAVRQRWAAVALALVVGTAIAAPNVAHLVNERRLFADALGLSNVAEALPLRVALEDLWRPVGGGEGTRILFFGAPFSILAVVACVSFAAVRPDLVIAAGISAVMLFTDWVPASWISARYQFRDPLTLCAILLAGCVASRLWSRRGTRPLAAVALLLQVAVVAATAWPLIQRTWEADGLNATAFRGATGDAAVSDGLLAAMARPGRLLYSPRIDSAVAERALVDDGLGINALAYRGAAVVNGAFKGISTDTLWPNDRLFHAWIRTPAALVDSDSSLDVLGIRYVLSERGEKVASGLREIWTGTTTRGAELVLFENVDAGPGAFLVDPSYTDRVLPTYAGCGHDRVLCRDVGALNALRDRDVTRIERGVNEIRLTWPSVATPRVLIVTEMYRPAWTAVSGSESLRTRIVYGGFIGVSLPPGTSSVHLRYRPRTIIAASIVCYGALALALLALAIPWRRRDASADPDSSGRHTACTTVAEGGAGP